MFTVDAGGKPIEPSLARFALQAMWAQKLQPTFAHINPLTLAQWEEQGVFQRWPLHDTRPAKHTMGGIELLERPINPTRIEFTDAYGRALAELTNIRTESVNA